VIAVIAVVFVIAGTAAVYLVSRRPGVDRPAEPAAVSSRVVVASRAGVGGEAEVEQKEASQKRIAGLEDSVLVGGAEGNPRIREKPLSSKKGRENVGSSGSPSRAMAQVEKSSPSEENLTKSAGKSSSGQTGGRGNESVSPKSPSAAAEEQAKIKVAGNSDLQEVELERFNRGVRYLKAGDLDAARREFSAVLEINPMNIDAMTNLSAIEIKEGNLKEARELLQRVLSIHPSHFKALLNLGILEYASGRYLAAEEILGRAQRFGDSSVKLLVNLSLVKEKLGKRDEALKLAETAVSRWPESPEGWYLLGFLQMKNGDEEGALEAFEKFLEKAKRDDPRREVVAEYLRD